MADRLIRLAIQAGVIAAVVAALPYKVFELDRYFVPKELVLHFLRPGLEYTIFWNDAARKNATSHLTEAIASTQL